MSAKESSPLKNPPSKKDVVVTSESISTTGTITTRVREKGGFQRGEEGKGRPVSALVVCSACGEMQNIVFSYGNVPNFHRCVHCGELMPTASYKLLMYGWPPVLSAISLRKIQHKE